MTTTMSEGTPVRDHILKMMAYLNEIQILGAKIDGETKVDNILQTLPRSFEQFCLNYNMNKREYTLAELLTELQAAEGIFRQSPQIHYAKNGSTSKSKGKKKKKQVVSAKKVNYLKVQDKKLV